MYRIYTIYECKKIYRRQVFLWFDHPAEMLFFEVSPIATEFIPYSYRIIAIIVSMNYDIVK